MWPSWRMGICLGLQTGSGLGSGMQCHRQKRCACCTVGATAGAAGCALLEALHCWQGECIPCPQAFGDKLARPHCMSDCRGCNACRLSPSRPSLWRRLLASPGMPANQLLQLLALLAEQPGVLAASQAVAAALPPLLQARLAFPESALAPLLSLAALPVVSLCLAAAPAAA